MDSSSKNYRHLFVFEGKKPEVSYMEALENKFLRESFSIKCIYGADIYQLYTKLEQDIDIDLFSLLKERNPDILKEFNRNSFAAIYLFFDYDAHATLAEDDVIVKMLNFFNNETENGMLYISYPMVEALRHYKDKQSFFNIKVKCKRGKDYDSTKCPYKDQCNDIDNCLKEDHYKDIVKKESKNEFNKISYFDYQVWKELISAHIEKANYLVNNNYSYPNGPISQLEIFESQLKKYINKRCPEVAVLCGFPLYVFDYFGVNALREKLLKQT